MQEEVISIEPAQIYDQAARMKSRGYRLVTLTCVELDEEHFELLYHFDQNLVMSHLRVAVPRNQTVPSISPVYLAAFLVENEIQDLFGLKFDGLVLDYGRTLYLEEEVRTTPFCKYGLVRNEPEGNG